MELVKSLITILRIFINFMAMAFLTNQFQNDLDVKDSVVVVIVDADGAMNANRVCKCRQVSNFEISLSFVTTFMKCQCHPFTSFMKM